jgi:hypothetical protein
MRPQLPPSPAAEAIDTCPVASATHKPAQFSSRTTRLRQGLGPAVRVRAVEGQRSILINAARILAARTSGFRADVNESASGAGLLGSGEYTAGALHVDAIPGVRRSPLLDEVRPKAAQ